ncbi:putative short-chain dehydrogenase/reductase family protein [Periconia macrospinosa]|uniref:Putative short-chain dehydrogenase/reductase family protein n=1 Tax=Periconia macrospinosa TaxID=97972 RepID=A0A2V1E865_9PLEO|nr:putative short-chain dehydrogenase/reductase family protein [Periconia macrospinosa]
MTAKNLRPIHTNSFKATIDAKCAKPIPPPSNQPLTGQTAIVTGSNVGLGLECCRQLLKMQLSHLIMAVRSIERGEAAAVGLRKSFPQAKIEVWALDMLSYDSIQSFAQRCSTELKRVNIAILNAGITAKDFTINKSTGHEMIFQVNYLSTAFLSLLLLPSLKKKSPSDAPGRLTVVSSGLGAYSEFKNYASVPLIPSFDDGNGWSISAAAERYNVSKTLVFMFVLKLGEHVESSEVIINTVDPGFCAGTDLHRNLGGPLKAIFGTAKVLIARSLEHGSWTYIDAAVGKGEESHGCLVSDWELRAFHNLMYTPEGKKATDQLWSETLDELKFAGVQEYIK